MYPLTNHLCSRCHGHDPNCPVCDEHEAKGEAGAEDRLMDADLDDNIVYPDDAEYGMQPKSQQ